MAFIWNTHIALLPTADCRFQRLTHLDLSSSLLPLRNASSSGLGFLSQIPERRDHSILSRSGSTQVLSNSAGSGP